MDCDKPLTDLLRMAMYRIPAQRAEALKQLGVGHFVIDKKVFLPSHNADGTPGAQPDLPGAAFDRVGDLSKPFGCLGGKSGNRLFKRCV